MQKPIHICILTSAHPLDDVRVNNKIAYSFRSAGFDVTWVGPNYSYFDHNNFNRYHIDYSLYPPRRGKIGRLLSLFLLRKTAKQIPDVDYFYSPEPDSALVAVTLKSKRTKVIMDIHEVYHEYMLANWARGWLFSILQPLVRLGIGVICARCDLVVGVCDNVLAPYRDINVEKMVVRSCAPKWFVQGDPANVCGSDRSHFTIMQGKSTLGRGTEIILEAISLAKNKVPNLRVIMFDVFDEKGENFGATQLRQKINELGLENVIDFRKAVTMQEMPPILQSCDLGLIGYNKQMAVSLPNKLFEYMASGLPILAPNYSKEVSKIINGEKCGILVDFEDPSAIADAIIYLYCHPDECREMGVRARNAFILRHNWETEVSPLLSRIQELSKSQELYE